jgi:WD40 repeat protein/tRNA A-37 threonylcarbamoyl transferase component Bud32
MTEETLFHKALAIPPGQRAAFLDAACTGEPELRVAVEALLAAHEASGSLLDRPAVEPVHSFDSRPNPAGQNAAAPAAAPPGATAEQPPRVTPPGIVAGRYTLVQQIGEGGMGEVWVAKQTEPVKRRVALKLIKPGMDSKSVLARFEQERQALALMDHPNIAKVLDGGITDDRRPFFVMELVNGLPLTRFCDEAKLGIRERLEIFTSICQAIQHAHQKGIVHRDLKPSNVLVTIIDGEPVPKIIDFGVAKATAGRLTDQSLSTQFGAVVGTLEYMSPEQAAFSGADIDTRADIYSLGVILYELLTGLRPIDAKQLRQAGLAEMFRIIKEEEPSRPSTRLSTEESAASLAALRHTEPKKLISLLRGELDWVVMRCLEKQRDRRYETANGLARDIQRYLADEPVEARPPSAGYRMQKFVRRNKGRVIAAGLVFLALVGGIIGTSWGLLAAQQALHAEAEQRKIAERVADEREQARSAAENEKDQKEQERKRADTKAAEALAEKQRANQKATDALVEKQRAEKQLLRSEWLLYASQIAAAQREWERNDFALAWQHLDACRADFRGWEHNYLYTLFTRNQRKLKGLTGPVLCVAISPDGKRIAGGSLDGTLKVWDTAAGNAILTLQGHTNPATCVAFDAEGKRIASGSLNGTLRVWNATSGQQIMTLDTHTFGVLSLAFSPDGKRIAIGCGRLDQRMVLCDATSGQETLGFDVHTRLVHGVAFSPDGKRIVCGGDDGMLGVWDAASGQEIHTLKGHTGQVNSVAFSPDSKRIVSGSEDQTLKLWDAATGEQTLTLKGHTGRVNSVAFCQDGKRIASGGEDQTLKIWDGTSGREILMLKGHAGAPLSLAFSPDGKWIASGGQALTVWDVTGGEEMLALKGHDHGYNNLAFSPDGKRIAHDGWDTPSPTSYFNALKVWDAISGKKMLTITGHTYPLSCVAFSPDGKWIVGGGLAGVKLWDAISGQESLTFKGYAKGVYAVAFSPDGKRVVAGDVYKALKLWDATSGQELLTFKGHTGNVTSVAFSPDGKRIVSGSEDKTLKVWDAISGQEVFTLTGHTSRVNSVAFSPDGKRIASGGGGLVEAGWAMIDDGDTTVRVWGATTGREILTLKGHTGRVNSVAFSPDGKRIVSGSHDKTLKFWDVTTGQETLTLKGHAKPVYGVAFSTDGKRIASGSEDQMLRVWDASRIPETHGSDNRFSLNSDLPR